MSALAGIALAVWILWAVLFCLGLCSAAARPLPQPARYFRRRRHEKFPHKNHHLDSFGRRHWAACNVVRHHHRQLVSRRAGERFGQGRRVLADAEVKTRARFRNHSRIL